MTHIIIADESRLRLDEGMGSPDYVQITKINMKKAIFGFWKHTDLDEMIICQPTKCLFSLGA